MRLRRRKAESSLAAVGGTGPLAAVTRYHVRRAVLEETLQVVSEAGGEGDELFVAWGGKTDGSVLEITSALVPEQRCIRRQKSVGVIIDADALFELNKNLYERGELLGAQAHAHPGEAFHSGADDQLALVTFPGGLSLVIPDFARHGFAAERRWRWYRLDLGGHWREIPRQAVKVAP